MLDLKCENIFQVDISSMVLNHAIALNLTIRTDQEINKRIGKNAQNILLQWMQKNIQDHAGLFP